jgi:MerR family transcriptional regulator, redox-sensitive transcriptional activator SoxR
MPKMNIGELARQAGLQTSAIRFYESIGLVPKPERVSGWRKYDPVALDRVKVIHAAREVGFSLDEIRLLLDGFPKSSSPSARWRKLARKKIPELDAVIERTLALKYLIESGLDCGCDDIALCINSEGKACRPDDPSLMVAADACSDEHCECDG